MLLRRWSTAGTEVLEERKSGRISVGGQHRRCGGGAGSVAVAVGRRRRVVVVVLLYVYI